MYFNKKHEVVSILHEWFILASERIVFFYLLFISIISNGIYAVG